MANVRLFFAVDTPGPVRSRIAALSQALQESGANVKWEPPAKLHCTVRFLGDTNPDLLDVLKEKASVLSSSTPVLLIRYRGLGCFPSQKDPRVVWVGMEDPEGSLAALHRSLDCALTTLGF